MRLKEIYYLSKVAQVGMSQGRMRNPGLSNAEVSTHVSALDHESAG